jgi:hypothetical protein
VPSLAEQVAALKAAQSALKDEAKKVKKSLKVCQKRAARLKKRAKEMTTDDLVLLLQTRGVAVAAGGAVTPGEASAAE